MLTLFSPATSLIWHASLHQHHSIAAGCVCVQTLKSTLAGSHNTHSHCWCAGTLPVAAWASLSGMTTFSINGSSMTGTLPNELATAWPKLSYLDLGSNRLAGEVHAHARRAAGCGGPEQVQAGAACVMQLTEDGHSQAPSQALGRRCRCSTLTCTTTPSSVRDVVTRQCRCVAAALPAHMLILHVYTQVAL